MPEVTAAVVIREVVVDSLAAGADSEAADAAKRFGSTSGGGVDSESRAGLVVFDEKRSQSIIDTTASRVSAYRFNLGNY